MIAYALMRLVPLFLVAGVLCAQIPAPESVLGHKPGDDFFLASYDESLAYFQKLAASTDKLKLVKAGKTTQGRDWYFAIISSSQNLKDFEKYRDIAKKLALVRGLNDEQARALARSGKVFVHIDGGLHATEVAGAQHTIQLAYNLVTGTSPEVANILDNVILMLWFSINPDGQNMVAHWYKQNLGTVYEVSNFPGLWQEYIGHDNNRDGYMNNMIESQVVTKYELEYYPQVFYNHHQTAPFPARIWIPPFGDPISADAHPLMWRWVNKFGTSMAAYLDEHGVTGAMHRGRFDDWYPGFIDHVNNFRNTISFLTETALYRYATPHFYTVDEFPQQRQPLNSEMMYASPWKGGWWHLADACRYMYGASMAVLDLSVKYREQMQYNKYRAARDTIEKFEKEPPFAYVIPREQHDAPTAALLVEKLMLQGIEVHQSSKPDAWVIEMDQPFSGLVKELFEPQKYPELKQRPYDVTGWTLPYQMGVEAHAITTPLTAEFKKGLEPITSTKGLAAPFNHNANASFRAVNQILAAKGAVSFSGDEISVSGVDKSKLDSILAENHLKQVAVKDAGKPVKAARTGLYRSWQANMDEGWTRWIFEQFDFPFTTLYNADIQAGHLHDKYDVIVLPDSNARSIIEGYRPGTIPERYAGGIGQDGVDELRDFVNDGGTLVAFNNASLFAIEQFHLPVTNALAGLNQTQFLCSGCLLKVHLEDTKNPLAAGLLPDPIVMFERGPAFDTTADFKGTVLARYARERSPLESGYLAGADRLEGKAAALDVTYGKGHILMLGFRPQWRGQSHGSYKFFFNALYLR